jgi:acetyl-CoA carboxylase carboxyltransferase component
MVNVATRAAREGIMAKSQDWQDTLDDLEQRRRHTRAMGEDEQLAKRHNKAKLDARACIDRLVDTGSFREIGTLVGGEIAPLAGPQRGLYSRQATAEPVSRTAILP